MGSLIITGRLRGGRWGGGCGGGERGDRSTERSQFGFIGCGINGFARAFAVGLEGFEAVEGGEEIALDGVEAPLEAGEVLVDEIGLVGRVAALAADLEV